MTAGWTPAVASAPAQGPNLEFEIASADRNDRMMLYSMLGVVGMTIAALGYAYLTKPKEIAALPAPPPIIANPVEPSKEMSRQQIYLQVDPNMTGFDPRTQWAPPIAPAPTPPVFYAQPRQRQTTVSTSPRTSSKMEIFKEVERVD